MKCKHAQSLISRYLADQLGPGELEEFIRHVEACPECYEELETYFMLNRALKFLDEENGISYNLKSLLSRDLRAKKNRLAKRKRRQIFWVVFCGVGILALLLACMDAAGVLDLSKLLLQS